MVGRRIIISEYDSAWPDDYLEEAARLREVFGSLLQRVHHIGSTAIPDMPAKPTIDIIAEVTRIRSVDGLNRALAGIGYEARGESGIPGRRYFRKGTTLCHTHHLHAFAEGDPHVLRHLVFRDYLRAHPEAATRYATLKRRLAGRFRTDPAAYTDTKGPLVRELEAKAMAWYRVGRFS